jgi:hypothetical protein
MLYAHRARGTDGYDQPQQVQGNAKRMPKTDPSEPMIYQIRIKGHLGRQWTDWFGGLTITHEDNGDTLVTGPVIDQAALYGLLRSVRDLAMPLISVMRIGAHHADTSDVKQ